MAALCWIAVTLAFFLSAENSLADVNPNALAKIVTVIENKYQIGRQFSLAVNIPEDMNKQDLNEQDLNKLEVFKNDPASVKEKILKDEVYQSTNMVIAKFKTSEKFTDHAEARVLDHIKPLTKNSDGNFLVFYSYLSPCGTKCTNTGHQYNIIAKLNVISNWKNYAFVFSKVFSKPQNGPEIKKEEKIEALKQLGNSRIGKNNIFRCYEPQNKEFKCIHCFNEGILSENCINNNKVKSKSNN